MTAATRHLFDLDDSFVRELEGLFLAWRAAQAPDPELVRLNEALAAELGADPDALRRAEGVAVLVGNAVPEGATPVAQAYSGHQFGNYSPRLGDGRALLLGEIVDGDGHRRDLHLKGSGRTPFARGGDGRAPLAPMLREYVISEAMAALGVPTTRSLAVVGTGETVQRETAEPGAVLVRVAASHLRVGTFQYAAALEAQGDDHDGLVRRLADHAIARHHPEARDAGNPYLDLLARVVRAQADLVAQWMLVGFVHGVMNTDNMTISGETIDYGPCAFLDAFDPATVYSSIDHGGRYAYGRQPSIAAWNLARLAEALLPLIDDDQPTAIERATEVVQTFSEHYARAWSDGLRAKLGLAPTGPDDLISDVLELMSANRVDFTSFFRALSDAARGDAEPARSLVLDLAGFDAWYERWYAALGARPEGVEAIADAMDRVNPAYVPRNHLVEEALTAAVGGDLAPFETLLDVLSRPYEARPGFERYASPDPDGGTFVTFCGT